MSYHAIDDSGQFNDSVVYLHPLRLTQGRAGVLAKHSNPEQVHLGIYDNIKLSSFLKNKQGKVIELVSVDNKSSKTFVNEDGEELLREYASNEIAFVMVAGNQNVGKSFFCDKILNLCEIRGNHFCRNKNAGIYIWSTPFEKDNLKIFLLEISGCSIQSEQFRILLTYSIMMGSAFIVIDDLKQKQVSALQQFDNVLNQIIGQISTHRQQGQIIENRNIVLPQFFFFLKRRGEKKEQNLSVISNYIQQKLPDALAPTYQGDQNELVHLPFLDVKCINQEYIRKTSQIFTELYEVITQKKYNDLTLTGSIILKVIKYVESYINNNYKISIEQLYEKVIEDLYQSAYNYCILSYHQQMERHFEDEMPKSLDQLLSIFENASNNVLQKFQQFNLDDKFHRIYQERLEDHIDEKQIMILDINKLKTQRLIHESYESSDLKDYQSYKSTVNRIQKKYPNLNHGQSDGIGRLVSELFSKVKNVDYKSLRQIQRLNHLIEQQQHVLADLKVKNDKKSKERSAVNKQHEELYQNDKRLQTKKKDIKVQIEKTKLIGDQDEPDEITREREHFQEQIRKNNETIKTLQSKGQQKKTKEIVLKQSKIEQTQKDIVRLSKILQEMKSGRVEIKEEGQKMKEEGKKVKEEGKKVKEEVKKEKKPK